MTKTKKNKKNIDEIHHRRLMKSAPKQVNPFEVHINKQKMNVLGKKMKNDKGLPGVARAKALQKRKRTLLNEYKLQHKSNKFIDKRINEKKAVPEDDKIMARFAAIRTKLHKKNIFNLADDDDFMLTHKGQTLADIEKHEDTHLDSDDGSDEDERAGRLGSKFVGDVHFGGGVLTDTGREGARTHKELIEQLIEESKKRKAEQQKTKAATTELTEELDQEWKDLAQLVNLNKKGREDVEEKTQLDDFDRIMRELKFQAREPATSRLKSEEEIAKEEKEKLERLEEERLERMRGFPEHNQKKGPTHRSADDLDDDIVYESDGEDDNMLTYDEQGQSNVQINAEINGHILGDSEEITEHIDAEENESEDEDAKEGSEEESDSDDSLADLKADDKSESESEPDNNQKALQKQVIPTKLNAKPVKEKSTTDKEPSETENIELEKEGSDLPFTFKLPDTYEDLMALLQSQSVIRQKIILERIVKCNHPSLGENNKAGLGILFAYELQYVNDLFSDVDDPNVLKQSFETFFTILPQICSLAQLNIESTHKSLLEVIKEKHQEYRKKKSQCPGLEVLVFFKIVSLLFSTSDFRHQVVTPCFIFMEQILKSCKFRTVNDISYGLFICTLILEYTSLSKRYFPMAVNFLAGILHMAIPKASVKLVKIFPPFKALNNDLVLGTHYTKKNIESKLNTAYLLKQEFTDDFCVSALSLTFKLVEDFIAHFKELSSNVEIFADVEKYLQQIPMKFYPKEMDEAQRKLLDSLNMLRSERKLNYLKLEDKKPKALRLYDPKIEAVYDRKQHKVLSKRKAEKAKLTHKLRNEKKGALREIRRDNAFLGRVKIKRQIQSDKERNERVKRIYAEASVQQSELNALDRKNKRKK